MDENERKKGMNQGIWLAVQELVYAGRGTGVFLWIDRG